MWPRARGHLGSYGVVNLTGPSDLAKPSLVWHPFETRFHDVVLCGPLIDSKANLYVTSARGIHKLSPDGRLIWRFRNESNNMIMCGSLSPDGSRLFNLDNGNNIFALDTETGERIWEKSFGWKMSTDTAYVENHDGVVIFQSNCRVPMCNESMSVFAVSAEDGSPLWQFDTDNPVWNLMAMFPEDGTVVFQDYDSKTYRLGLHNGSLLWKAGGRRHHEGKLTWSDGGCILGNNGAVYAASSGAFIADHHPLSGGGVHARRLSDGALLWERALQRPFFTWPAVGRLAGRSDSSVIVAVGANGYFPVNTVVHFLCMVLIPLGMFLGAACSLCRCCRGGCKRFVWRLLAGTLVGLLGVALVTLVYISGSIMPIQTFHAEVYAFNAETGEQQWVYKLPHWNRWYSAGDWEGYWERTRHIPSRPLCLPAAYSSPTIDAAGTVYIGYMDGGLYALKDTNGDGVVQGGDEVSRVETEGAFLHSGPAIVPGMMAVTNCEQLFVWRM